MAADKDNLLSEVLLALTAIEVLTRGTLATHVHQIADDTIARIHRAALEKHGHGIDPRRPVPELADKFPMVLYFGSAEDRDDALAQFREAHPQLTPTRL
jgi:hypothetical protein